MKCWKIDALNALRRSDPLVIRVDTLSLSYDGQSNAPDRRPRPRPLPLPTAHTKPLTNGPLQVTVIIIGTLAADGWIVTFGAVYYKRITESSKVHNVRSKQPYTSRKYRTILKSSFVSAANKFILL